MLQWVAALGLALTTLLGSLHSGTHDRGLVVHVCISKLIAAVSTPIFETNYYLFSIFRDLQDEHSFTSLEYTPLHPWNLTWK